MERKCPACGWEVKDGADRCPSCGLLASEFHNYTPGSKKEKSSGCLLPIGIVVVVLIAVIFINGALNQHYGGSTSSQSSGKSVTVVTEKNEQPSTWQFGDDAEQVVKELKDALGSKYKYTWTASGYKLTFTVKIQELSGDDLADLYAADAAEAQKIIDNLNESMKSANSGTLDRFKILGYKSPTVVFSMVTSDDMEVCTVTNGKITHSITKDNFRYG